MLDSLSIRPTKRSLLCDTAIFNIYTIKYALSRATVHITHLRPTFDRVEKANRCTDRSRRHPDRIRRRRRPIEAARRANSRAGRCPRRCCADSGALSSPAPPPAGRGRHRSRLRRRRRTARSPTCGSIRRRPRRPRPPRTRRPLRPPATRRSVVDPAISTAACGTPRTIRRIRLRHPLGAPAVLAETAAGTPRHSRKAPGTVTNDHPFPNEPTNDQTVRFCWHGMRGCRLQESTPSSLSS